MSQNNTYKLPDTPTVTVAIPTLNEEEYIEDVVLTFINDSYQGEIEILIADGGSGDNTRQIVTNLNKRYKNIHLLDNPDKNQVFAFNIMLNKASGDLFMLAGAHAEYPENYISKCVELIKKKDAVNVGGSTRLAAKTHIQAGILFATYSYLGNGGANHKKMNYSGYTDTLFPGFYITQALHDIGGFNTQNISNQDTEINMRLSQLTPKAHYLSGDIKVYYFPRATYNSLLKQYFRYGRGRCITTFRHPSKAPIRAYLSFVVLWVLTGIGLYLISQSNFSLLAGLATFLVITQLADTVKTYGDLSKNLEIGFWKKDEKAKPDLAKMAILGIPAVILMHIGMWTGFTFQLLKNISQLKNRW